MIVLIGVKLNYKTSKIYFYQLKSFDKNIMPLYLLFISSILIKIIYSSN